MSVTPGHMVLYDRMQPALPADSYRVEASTEVEVETDQDGDGTGTIESVPLRSETRYLDIVGPRFRLQPTELAGVFPPRNGHGDFTDTIPHVAFGRRTLPWEQDVDPKNELPAPAPSDADGAAPALTGIRPWIALLLFEEDEITIMRGKALEDVLPQSVRTAIDAPSGIECDSIVVERNALLDVLPTPDEMEALTHVRQVNVDDRELAAGDSDGWFSVVMGSRLPIADRKYRACIVSLEGRMDLFEKLRNRPPPGRDPGTLVPRVTAERVAELERLARAHPDRTDLGTALEHARRSLEMDSDDANDGPDPNDGAAPGDGASVAPVVAADDVSAAGIHPGFVLGEVADWVTFPPLQAVEEVVLLASWSFECVGTGTFRLLAQSLDVGMVGENAAGVQVADSGHVAIKMRNRAGSEQTAWYRGPLAPYPMTRDEEGPYHSADQCRRVTPESGMEDVSYSAAFEVGRLLATSDGRLAQELMRWRRTAYRAARRILARRGLADGLDFADILDPRRPLAPLLSARFAEEVIRDAPRIDRFERELVAEAPGLDPAELTRVWKLADVAEAEALLAGAHADEIGGVPTAELDLDERVANLRQLRGRMLDTMRRNGG